MEDLAILFKDYKTLCVAEQCCDGRVCASDGMVAGLSEPDDVRREFLEKNGGRADLKAFSKSERGYLTRTELGYALVVRTGCSGFASPVRSVLMMFLNLETGERGRAEFL